MNRDGAGGQKARVPVVVLGASAGGLPALEAFFGSAPASSGVCWVVVQHLDPTRETLLVRILQRFTPMPVKEVCDGLAACADTVLVMPPNATLTLGHDGFHLQQPVESRGRRRPVDAMFRSLAATAGPLGAGVVLSGSGSDGVIGVRVIRAAGGLTLAQEPRTAQFGSMPSMAIESGCVDIVAPPQELPQRVLAALARRGQARGPSASGALRAWPTRQGMSAASLPQVEGGLPSSPWGAARLPVKTTDSESPAGPAPRLASQPDVILDGAVSVRPPSPQAANAQSAAADPPATFAESAEASTSAEKIRSLTAILHRLHKRSGYDLFLYKRSTLWRRIQRRMAIHRIQTVSDYEQLLRHSDGEADLLAREILVGVTGFFRDRDVWQVLQQRLLPELLRGRENGSVLRAWVAGCSTGEEAYTLAMAFREVVQASATHDQCTLQIFATDLSEDAIERARRGCYPASIAGELSAERLRRHFVAHPTGWRVSNEIREMVVFAPHDVNVDPPFTRLDLLCCRNLLIYFTAPLQRRLMPLFHYSLRPGGVLVLGSSETIGRFDDLFETMDARLRLYRRCPASLPSPVPDFSLRPPGSAVVPAKEPPMPDHPDDDPAAPANLQGQADRLLLSRWTPPAVLVNASGDIVHINGRTGRYLEPAAGKANWNVHVMARPGLRVALSEALRRADTQRVSVEVSDLPIDAADGPPAVDLSVQPLDDVPGLRGMTLVVFREAANKAARPRRRPRNALTKQLEAELQQAREETQSLREEMRASQEELQAANEELQSTNEELQSTNEELTSSKEEMQSMNEELQAVNAELHAKLDDLAVAQSDMRNLLNSTDIATLFLDRHLHVRRFTERARKIISLRDSDVGRPLTDLTSSLDYPALEDDVREMLRTLVPCERHVRGREGPWFAVRILPYRTQDDVIDGAVITFVDISAAVATSGASLPPPPLVAGPGAMPAT